jgi:hypothetical protein
MDRQTAAAWSRFAQGWEAIIKEYGWLPREKLWVDFLANNQELAGHLGFEVDPAAHWPATQSGCPMPCVICDAPETDGEFAGFLDCGRVWGAAGRSNGAVRRAPVHLVLDWGSSGALGTEASRKSQGDKGCQEGGPTTCCPS